MSKRSMSKIAVTGCGCICAAGADTDAVWRAIQAGLVNNRADSNHLFLEREDVPVFAVPHLALPAIFAEAVAERAAGGELNRTIILTLTAVAEAIGAANLTVAQLRTKRVGIALGTTVGCTFNNEDYYIQWQKGESPDLGPVHRYLSANLAERVQDILGVRGPRAVVTNACASGTDAIGLAKMWLDHDLCDLAIAGGADELSRIACQGFNSLMLVSQNSCTPFGAKRDGLNLGEGAGILCLEKEAEATASQREIKGWVCGYGAANDAYHPTAPHPEGRGLQDAVSQALAAAGLGLADISLINAHGTGTPANDRAETAALSALGLGEETTPIVSTKGATGHTLGAAGGIEAVLTLLALGSGKVSGTIGCHTPDPELAVPVLSAGEEARLSGRMGISQSLAFGGGNSALVLEGGGP